MDRDLLLTREPCLSLTNRCNSLISSAVNAIPGLALSAARFIMVIQKMRQLRIANTEIKLTSRLAVRSLEASVLQPDFRIL